MGRYYDDELYHHGVIGMKWGVHKANKLTASGKTDAGRKKLQSTYDKSTKKLQKLDRKIEKYQAKSVKLRQKADRNRYGWFGSQKKANKLSFKADRQQFKANKKAEKGLKHINQMKNAYKNTSLKSLDKSITDRGKRYEQMLRTRAQTAMR